MKTRTHTVAVSAQEMARILGRGGPYLLLRVEDMLTPEGLVPTQWFATLEAACRAAQDGDTIFRLVQEV